MAEFNALVWVLLFVISVVMLFAQLKLFSIDSRLKEIRDELRKQKGKGEQGKKSANVYRDFQGLKL